MKLTTDWIENNIDQLYSGFGSSPTVADSKTLLKRSKTLKVITHDKLKIEYHEKKLLKEDLIGKA
jgi:hypothetical protein